MILEFKYVAKEVKKRIKNKKEVNMDLKLGTRGKLFKRKDFQPEHLRIIYKFYKDRIVDLYLNKKILPIKSKLIQLKK